VGELRFGQVVAKKRCEKKPSPPRGSGSQEKFKSQGKKGKGKEKNKPLGPKGSKSKSLRSIKNGG